MAIGKGGSTQDQNGSSASQGSSVGNQVGGNYSSNNGAISGVSSSKADPTAGWGSVSNILQRNLGTTGLTGDQQMATDAWKGYLTSNDNNGVHQMERANDSLQPLTTAQAHNAAPTSAVGAPSVAANTGASFMDAYRDPYTNQVVNATENDLGNQYDKHINQIKMAAAAGGAFGGGRQGVAEGQATDDFMRTLATTDAGLRSQGFNSSANLGMTDANRFLQGDAANQSASLAASQANAANTLNNNTFNANQANVADTTRLNAANSISNNAANQVTTGGSALDRLYGYSGGGNTNLTSFMNSQVPAFGQTGTQSQNTSNQGGTVSANLASGANQNAGTQKQNSTGKNGGVSFG